VNLTPELHQIKDLEEKIRRLSQEQARTTTDPEFQHRLNAHLLALVEQRAHEAERYNRLLQEHVHELQVRKERMATTVHDLKIPVTISLLNLELAESEAEAEVRLLHLTAVRRELEFLLDTIGNLLDLEREGKGDLGKIEPINLSELTTQVLDRMRILIRDKPGLRLANELPADLPRVRCDVHRMTRVLSNLLSNAIKYTDAGAITIGTPASRDPDSPGIVRIFVRDTGVGIDPSRRDQLFHLFSGDESRYDSSGVGLVFVKKTVEAYGGRVFLESQKGTGTCVTLELPLAKA
jgi:signal transduction histidine kinase